MLKLEKPALDPENMVWFIYSLSGVGKTVFASRFSQPGQKMLLINTEGKTRTQSAVKFALTKELVLPDVLNVSNTAQFDEALSFAIAEVRKKTYQVVGVDSLTRLEFNYEEDLMLSGYKKKVESIRASTGQDPTVAMPESFGEAFKSPMQAWGKVLVKMMRILKTLQDLGCTVVLTSLAREFPIPTGHVDEDGKPIMTSVYRPHLWGQIKDSIAAFTNILAFYEVSGLDAATAKRVMHFHPSQKFWAKDDSSSLPPSLQDPTPQKVISLIKASIESWGKSA